MLDWYQSLPEHINPIIFSLGFFSVRWYAALYILGFFTVYWILLWRIRHKEGVYSQVQIENLLFFCFLGAVTGARIGYVLLYNWEYFSQHGAEIFLPYDFTSKTWVGLYGLSYHGGLIGALMAAWVYAKMKKLSFLQLSDFVVPAVGAGYFFGRIGNFLNGELYGRATNSLFGMYFEGNLRYPSQLIEAFFEGIVIFIILWNIRNKRAFKGFLFFLYGLLYACARFFSEFFREPDVQVGFIYLGLTQGQLLSLIMFGMFLGSMLWFRGEKKGIL